MDLVPFAAAPHPAEREDGGANTFPVSQELEQSGCGGSKGGPAGASPVGSRRAGSFHSRCAAAMRGADGRRAVLRWASCAALQILIKHGILRAFG
ncbi:hypothetical protein E2C01_036239 [Portunus trituberculatus]|uniref:Uncharacterized protein n=1 Tax=Portunus trituberculatus TaxID=210409 RepID=A0A5B7FDQ0_PORTR|nr:hypothetical protein [Portunus trituberculatus]